MLSLVPAVLAQEIDLRPSEEKFLPLTDLSVATIVQKAISMVLVVAAIIFFFVLVIGGIRWIVSGGDKAQTEAARNQITAALVGLVIVFSAWAIAKLIQAFFGVDILSLPNTFQQ